MKILYVTGTNIYSAGNRVLIAWIDYLLPKGFDIYVASPPGGTLSLELKKRLPASNLIFCDFPIISLKTMFNFFSNFSKIMFFIHRVRPDLIHCNGEDIYLMMRYFSKLYNLPIILHLRFHWSEPFYRWIFKSRFYPNLIYTVSNALYEEEVQKIKELSPNVKIKVLHNCIDLNYINGFLNKKFYFEKTCFHFGVVGAIQERKGQHFGIKLASILNKKYLDFVLHFAGRIKSDSYFEKFKQEISKHKNLEDKIDLMGFVNNIYPFMKACDIIFSFSSYETFGMVVLECMAVGTPLLGFSCAAIDEVLGCKFLTVPHGDVEALAELALEIINNKSFHEKISQHFEERIHMFTPKNILPQLVDDYNSIIATKIA